jgi:iron complex outermembrane receptor protein
MRRVVVTLGAVAALVQAVAAQPSTAVVQVQVRDRTGPVAGVSVLVNSKPYRADAAGQVTVELPPGRAEISVTREGFFPASVTITLAAEERREVLIELAVRPTVEEEITVSATRIERGLDDQPTRVEVLGREEIEEKLLMTPGDIVMLLNEMGGLRVQATSPSLGAASVRVQGMRGRYTRFLADGLPLFGAQTPALGLLQIPPMDVGQIEVIKGNASSFYGAGAMGGVVNLISRRPGDKPERQALFNRSSRGATDAILWWAAPLAERWGLTLLSGGHWQQQNDVDGDGWADLPGYARGVLRPRLFWHDNKGRSFFATAGVTYEDRTGGTVRGRTLPAFNSSYREAIDSVRVDAGGVGQMLVGKHILTGRLAVAEQRHDHQFGENRERDRHHTVFGEIALRGTSGRHTWVSGVALERDVYRPRDLPRFAYTFMVPGVFAQDEIAVAKWFTLSAGARLDHHSAYGPFFSPRLSALLRSGAWSSRLSAGAGFFGPSPLNEETEASGLSRLTIPRPLRAERGNSVSFDLTRASGPAAYTITLFGSRVRHPVHVDRGRGLVLENLADPTTNLGTEFIATWRRAPWSVVATYLFVRSREVEGGRPREVSLTPRHSAGVDAMLEWKNLRLGLEWYYTGVQRLEENPYRDHSRPYMIAGALAEWRFGPLRLFINGENLTGVRQTRWDPLLRPNRAPDGRWTVDAWAPLEGRNVNGGFRLNF